LSRHGFALLVAMLAGCASLPESPSSTGRTCFELEGRIAIDREGRGVLANMHWVQRPDGGVIELGSALARPSRACKSGPTKPGSPHPNGYGRPNRVERSCASCSASTCRSRRSPTGVVGQLPPNAEIERDAVGRPASAHFQGYSVRYADHTSDEPDGRPTRIDIRRHALHMRLKIDHWESCP
jgi:outer membrane biogenesis lipoprotein LolB